MEISTRSYWTAGTALTAAAITLSPLIVGSAALEPTPILSRLPAVSAPNVALAAVVSPKDIDALVARLNSALASVSSTVNSVVALPGNSLTAALESAVAVNDSLWNGLINATDNLALTELLRALRATASGGLSRLSTTVGDSGDALVLTSGEVTDLLASALTGSLSTALHAVATIVNNPLALTSYTALLNVPRDIAGLVLNNGLSLVNSVGKSALSVTNSLVTGITAQIDNVLSGVNGMIDAAKGAIPGVALLDGVLTAVQGIVSAPVTAALAGIDGLSGTLSDAAARALGNLAHGGTHLASAWLGDGASGGALQTAINAIGAAPLSLASYTRALGVVVSAGISSVRAVVNTGTGLLSVPFTAGADLTSTASAMITKFTDGVATAASGILHAVGLPAYVAGLPRALAATINITVRAAAFAVSTGLNAIAAALDIGSVKGSSVTAVPDRASAQILLDGAHLSSSGDLAAAASESSYAKGLSTTTREVQLPAASAVKSAAGEVTNEVASAALDTLPDTQPVSPAEDPQDPNRAADTVISTESSVAQVGSPTGEWSTSTELTVATSVQKPVAIDSAIGANQVADSATGSHVQTDRDADNFENGQAQRSTNADNLSAVGTLKTRRALTNDTASSRPGGNGRHASGETAPQPSSTPAGRHRSDSAGSTPSTDAKGAASPASGADADTARSAHTAA